MTDFFTDKIYGFGKRYFRMQALASTLRFLTIVLLLWLSVALADDLFYFSEITRWGIWFINLGVVLWLVFTLLFNPIKRYFSLSRKSDLSALTRLLGRLYPEIGDDLVNAYQLAHENEERLVSEELKEAAVRQIVSRYEDYDFERAIRFKNFFPEWKWAAGFGLVFLLMFGLLHDALWISTLRILNPTRTYAQLPAFEFKVLPGDTTLVKGDPLKISVEYRGPELEKCYVVIHHTGDKQFLVCQPVDNGFTALLKNVQQSFTYKIAGEPLLKKGVDSFLESREFRAKVIALPFVKILDVTVLPPSYTGLGIQKLERNIGDVQALRGSTIKVRAVSASPLRRARLVFESGDTLNMNVNNQIATGRFTLKKEDAYHIVLVDTAGYRNRNPIRYRLSVLSDYQPLVEIVRPGEDLELTLDSQLPVSIDARDDFGLQQVKIVYQIVHDPPRGDTLWQAISLPLAEQGAKHVSITHVLDFNTFPLAFGDQFKYYAMALDNNVINGPGRGKSRIYYIRFPSIEEIFQAVDETQQENVEDLQDVVKEAKTMKENLEKLEREIKQSQKLDWEKKNQLAQDLERQKRLQKKVEQIRKELDEAIKKLEQNDLISEELLQKYMKLQDLFREVLTPELEEALKKLNQALEKGVRPKDVERALKEFRLNQQAFEEKIERTMELLKQVQFEQKMEELVKKAEALYKQQEKMSQQLKEKEKLNSAEKNRLLQQQKKQEQLTDRLQFDLQELQKNPMLARYPEAQKQIDSALTQMQNGEMKQGLKDLQQSLQQSNTTQAQNSSQRLQQQYQSMKSALQQAYQKMLNQSKQKIAQKMQRTLERLLQLSQAQERLQRKTKQTSQLSEKFNEVIRQQGQLNENLNKAISDVVQLSKETFFIQPQMSKSLQNAARSMNRALQQLSERFKNSAMQSQRQAMSALNQSIGQMMQAQQQMAGSSSGTGFEQFMQQLQQMANQQGQLNNETMNLFGQGNQGRLSLEQQQAMQRLAAQQAALKQALQKLSEEMGERQNVLGRLGQVAQEMEKVVKDLLNKNISRKTIERQQRILSRMLDAQKSIREREYSKKRKAEQAKKYLARDPRKLENIYDLDLKQLQDAMRNALQQGYNRDYQILIEAYFKKLMERYQNENQ
ncbi:hypothetical protein Calab_0677 [Caldithrix abyssi DSM 13497]|uniref:Chromosome segregation ATPase-like protein n=1 Tax=Caldithrix abyssi DSM 13497 TaxID=880073 RepID=H1XSU0_CALAY|nr:DUF4175 family protein [Caldithrix abyssi]APF20266.1 hypothetical protein Cabys_3520 [Caldithrix abyssi DSM 13497]EHO40317.1 hypothetical protein Calab_0677 [Caldithrix abyssi DSM 13497]